MRLNSAIHDSRVLRGVVPQLRQRKSQQAESMRVPFSILAVHCCIPDCLALRAQLDHSKVLPSIEESIVFGVTGHACVIPCMLADMFPQRVCQSLGDEPYGPVKYPPCRSISIERQSTLPQHIEHC
jgi:hypothetical protein